MTKPFTAFLWFATLAIPALAAVNKDGGQPSVNPCLKDPTVCDKVEPEADRVTEPMVIFLDAEGNTLVRMPLSKFRKAEPDAKLPPDIDTLR